MDAAELLEKLEIKPTAMIDISDGLSSEILHLCKQSNVGCNLYEEKIPVDPQLINVCEEFNLDITTIALSGGEDYELLFTIDEKDIEKIRYMPDVFIIGEITEAIDGLKLHTTGGNIYELTGQGWQHF